MDVQYGYAAWICNEDCNKDMQMDIIEDLRTTNQAQNVYAISINIWYKDFHWINVMEICNKNRH